MTPMSMLCVFLLLLRSVRAADPSGCLISWKIANWTEIVNGVVTQETNVDACYKYPLLTWVNIILFFVLWMKVTTVLLFGTH